MLGDYYKNNTRIANIIDAAVEIVKWFNNHSYALGVLNVEQASIYAGKIWALIIPVISRWTAHFCSLSRLLDMNRALQITALKHEAELIQTVGRKQKAKNKAMR